MRSLHTQRRLASVVIALFGAMASGSTFAANTVRTATSNTSAPQKEQFVDGIAAVVNKQVITLNQVNAEVQGAQAQLRQQKIAVPDIDTLRRQVLQRMITEELIRQEADRLKISVSDAQLERAVQTIAQRNKITPDQLRREIEKSGLSWKAYLESLRLEVRTDQLRQRAVDSTITVSDSDVDIFLKSQARKAGGAGSAPAQAAPAQQTGPRVLGLAQILVAVPEGASSSQVNELRQKAEAILTKLRSGADFGSVAAASSDGPQALKGGDLGVRPPEGWPDLFLQVTQNLQEGQFTGIVQSGNGFHILKVVTRGAQAAANAPAAAPNPGSPSGAIDQQGPMMVTQTHASHILIKTTKAMSEERALARLNELRQRAVMGENFEDLAKRYSEDASAPQGGDLGWLSPGETVPPFEQAMNTLEPGQISEPVQTPFGWHLIRVTDRRTKNMENEFKRMQARQILFQRRAEPAFEDWLSQLHGQAYIDNRLDPKSNRQRVK